MKSIYERYFLSNNISKMRIRQFFRKLFMRNYNMISETAYHESGHVCISYLAGFTVEYVMVDNIRPGNGLSAINYGEIKDVVKALFDLDTNADTFNSLTTEKKSKSKSTTYRLNDSLVGGPIAEARYKALRDKMPNMEVVVEYSDYRMSIIIQWFVIKFSKLCGNFAIVP
jgi:hypothetical protein